MSTPQLASFRDRLGNGALMRRAAKVERRKSFRQEAAGVLSIQNERIAAIESVLWRKFWGRVKFFFLGC